MLKVEDVLRLCDNVGAEVELHRDISHYAADYARWWCTIAAHKRRDSTTSGLSRDEINVRRGGADGGTALIAAWMAFDRLAGEGLSLPRLAVVEHAPVMAKDDGPYNPATHNPPDDDIPF